MSEPLKPCPFCGDDPELSSGFSHVADSELHYIACYNCGAFSPAYASKAYAIQAWNKRADDKYNELVEFLISFVINADCADNVKDCVPCEAYELLRKHGVEV